MAKISGQDMFQILLIGIGLLFVVGFVIKTTGVGDNFDLSNLGDIATPGGANFIFEVILALATVFIIATLLKKVRAGSLDPKTVVSLVILGLALYYSVKVLANLGFVDADIFNAVLTQSVMP